MVDFTQYKLSLPSVVPSFRILSQVDVVSEILTENCIT